MSKKINIISKFLYLLAFSPAVTSAASIIENPTGPPVVEKEAISSLVSRLTQIVVGAAGIITVAMVIYGGVMLVTSAGNEEKQKKAKAILTYAIFGLIFTVSAYIIVFIFAKALGGNVS